MKRPWLGVTALCATALAASPAFAASAELSAKAQAVLAEFPPLGPNDEVVPIVAPGEVIGIACNALTVSAPGNEVRVVLTISAEPSEAPAPGYRKVLATNEDLSPGAVHVRVPEMPDLTNHTVNVNVYVVNALGLQDCNAGHMHIADISDHTQSQQS